LREQNRRGLIVYIAMNRFHIKLGFEMEFEKVWKTRETYLNDVDGFIKFNLIRGKSDTDFTLYASHSTWETEQDFLNWTKSDSFKLAHKNAGQNSNMYLGHPIFEGFNIVI
tara:strand:- start:1804 stop:2136 length:333 start_codon:yes stop_codon:yes gene_type:complete